MYNDETQDISITEQMAIYATFEHNNHISEHFIGIMPISEMVESTLNAPNILAAINKYLQEKGISIVKGRFFFAWTQPT